MQHLVKVKQLMSAPVVSLEPQSLVSSALELAALRDLHHFPVMSDGHAIGLVCTCDLRAAKPSTTVTRWMRTPVVSVLPDATAEEAGRKMVEHVVGSAVVSDGEGVYGIVTCADLTEVSHELDQLMRETRCRGCRVQQHLRKSRDGQYWCVTCYDRGAEDPWFDVGGGD